MNVGARIAAWEEGVGWNVRAWQFTEVYGNFESKNYFNITNSFGPSSLWYYLALQMFFSA